MKANTKLRVINKTSDWRKLLKFTVLAEILICGVFFNTPPALAWKPTTHVYLAEQALEDARDNGRVTINRVNAETGEIIGQIGEYPVDPDILSALRAFPAQYRAGVIGPDAYPDMLTGQEVIHPRTNPDGSNRWLEYLWAQSNESLATKAFVVGYLTHAAGDMYGHTFINNFTGGDFIVTPPENAIKHILLETYIDKRAPSPNFDASISGVEDFIYRHMVDAKPGSYLDRELLRQQGENTQYSIPRIYSTLRMSVEGEVNKKCGAINIICKLEREYAKAWRDDIDEGLKAWPQVSHEVAKALFFNPEKTLKAEEAEKILKNYVNKHLISMSGAPDVVGELAVLSDKITDIISRLTPNFLVAPIRDLKNSIYDAIVVRATGMTREQLKEYLSNPKTYFDQVMTQGSGQTINRHTFDSQYLRLDADEKTFDYRKFPAAYNTVTMSKLLLLSKEGVNQLLADLGDNSRLDKPNIMLGFINTLDGGNEQKKMILARNCSTYRQIFMQQIGEDFCKDKAITKATTRRFTGYMTTIPRVVYRAADGHIHELSVTNDWSHFDITAATNAPAAAGEPFGYMADVPRVVYRGVDGHIHELYLKDGQWKHYDLTAATGAPTAAGDPMGYVGDVPRVVYRGVDGHIHELYVKDTWKHYDLTAATGAPTAAGDPMGYVGDVPRVVYRGVDGHIHELYVKDTWKHFDLFSQATGAPAAVGEPFGYMTNVPRVVYRGVDGHIHELYATDTWKHFDLFSQAAGAVTASGDPMGYMTNVPRVVYRGVDEHIHELYVTDTWKHFDLSSATGGPS